ncbi:DEAD/DEAH box helicase family protein [Patescibacteria group bacterium]|nr:DEAD/DEAH box helicase family protein [Patescibacteria group bacterium]MBU4125917.1 DEAD/DEAH box helicase family protein [Patescibacteria group bacterium]
MNLQLKLYQDEKVEELKNKVNELLELDGSKLCIFEAPTGSGKTIMVGEFLKRLVNPLDREDGKQFSFIWISVRDLHSQSKKSLNQHFENCFCYSSFGDIRDNIIGKNEILFLNWEKLYNKDRIYIRDNEKGKNLSNIVENTKQTGREIILIIDESHHTNLGPNATRVRADIAAKITLEVSATPIFHDPDGHVKVHFEKVVEGGMIKKEVAINPEFQKFKVNGKSSREMVIEAAIEKRKELLEAYKAEGSDINPLVLIQLPNLQKGINDLDKDVLTDVQKILKRKYDITEDNDRMAIWLADNKTPNLVNIEKATNEVEVLVFKQAIALGWDCPRAQILVIFRETASKVFLLQTVGRIMRMPEYHHYENHPTLDKAYVFTNIGVSEIKLGDEIAKEYFTFQEAKRNDEIYKNLDLPSIHFKRQREKTRLSSEFSKIFMEISEKLSLKKKLNIKKTKISNEIIVDGKIINIDKARAIEHSIMNYHSPDVEIQMYYDLFCKASAGEFAPFDSMNAIKSSLNRFFTRVMGFENDDPAFYKVILNPENINKVSEALAMSREEYKRTIVAKDKEREMENLAWNVPKVISYNSKYKAKDLKKSVMTPYYSRFIENGQASLLGDYEEDSKVETDFINYIDKAKNIEWWFKNGQGEVNYFAVPYVDKYGKKSAFYVDFIIQLRNGDVWLLDTKKGQTAESAKERAEGLAKYIKEQKKKGKKLFGGIVIPADKQWRYNDNEKYEYNPNDLKNWKFLGLS